MSSKIKDLINYLPRIHRTHTDSQTNWRTNTHKKQIQMDANTDKESETDRYTLNIWAPGSKRQSDISINTSKPYTYYKLGCLIFRHLFVVVKYEKNKFKKCFQKNFCQGHYYEYKKIKTYLYKIHKYVTGCHEKPPDDHEDVVFILICSLYCLTHELKNIFAVHQLHSACTFASIIHL